MLHIKEITNKKIWDDFLQKNHSGSFPFFQTWNWGEVLQELSVSVDRIGLFEDKKLVGVLLLVEVKAKRGHYLYMRHGPILHPFDNYHFTFLLDYIKRVASTRGASFVRVSRLTKRENMSEEYFRKLGFIRCPLQTIDMEACWVLDITKSEDELLRNMRKTHRYLVKKAQSLAIEIIKSADVKDISLFLPLYKELSERKHFVPHKELVKEFEIFSRENQSVLFLAKINREVIAGAIIDFIGDEAMYRHGAMSEKYKNVPASYLLQWEAILEAKRRNKKRYNFFGVAPNESKNHPWYGLTLFKTGFGGEKEFFLPVMDLPLNIWYWKNYAIDFLSKIKKTAKG